MFAKRITWTIAFLFLFVDSIYTFTQNNKLPLDGDLCGIVLPSNGYKTVMQHPFGLLAIQNDSVYAAPNRYFAHLTMYAYFRSVPYALQHWVDPLSSLYISAALAKTAIQIILILILSLYVSLFYKHPLVFPTSIVLFVPFFQTGGFFEIMGIVDVSVTYAFFYAWPLSLLLATCYPLIASFVHNTPLNKYALVLYIALSPLLFLNAPVIQGVAVVALFLYFVVVARKVLIDNNIEYIKRFYINNIILLIFGLVALYSLYLGTFNAENNWESLPLIDRFSRLPKGFIDILTLKPGLGIIALCTLVMFYMIKKGGDESQHAKIFSIALVLLAFSIVFTFLLPFGGYRSYRPLIIRRDSYLPVILIILFIYALFGNYIIYNYNKYKNIMRVILVAVGLFFTVIDAPIQPLNACEKEAIYYLQQAKTPVVQLPFKCSVINWSPIHDAEYARPYAQFMVEMNVLDSLRLYVQP